MPVRSPRSDRNKTVAMSSLIGLRAFFWIYVEIFHLGPKFPLPSFRQSTAYSDWPSERSFAFI